MTKAPAVTEVETGWHSNAEITGIMIGTPAYGGLVTARYLTSAIETSRLLEEALRAEDGRQAPVAWCVIEGESLVHRARNNIVAKFMAARPTLSHLIFVDADLEWTPRDLLRLIGHDLPVVCGVYPKKTEPPDFPFHPLLDEKGVARRNQITGAIQIANGPTGFLCVKREVFVEMREAYPQLKFTCPKASPGELEWLYAYFDTYVEEGILWSEDYGFCRRWRALGGEIWCDPEIRLGHVGQRIYTGSVADLYQPAGTPYAWQGADGDPWFGPRARSGDFDQVIIAAALAHVPDFGCAVDVGAHIGTWTRSLAAHFKRVIAIEPNRDTFRSLLANTADLSTVVRHHMLAAWDCRENLVVSPQGANSGEVNVSPSPEGTVIGLPLDEIVLEPVDLIKIDVEAATMRVLQGALQIILEFRPVIVVEEERTTREASSWLSDLGMREVARHPIAPGHLLDNVVMAWAA